MYIATCSTLPSYSLLMAKELTCSDRVIQLNVGGKLFETLYSTLTNGKSQLLTSMFTDHRHWVGTHDVIADGVRYDANGVPFVDRDGHAFVEVLEFLRSSDTWTPPDGERGMEKLRAEAAFFNISSMVTMLDRAIEWSKWMRCVIDVMLLVALFLSVLLLLGAHASSHCV